MTIGPAPMCFYCKHLIETLEGKDDCKAFREEIPDKIYWNHYDHRQEFPGDKGIRFEAVNEEAKKHVEELYNFLSS